MKEVLSKQAVKIAKRAEEHQSFINKVHSSFGCSWLWWVLLPLRGKTTRHSFSILCSTSSLFLFAGYTIGSRNGITISCSGFCYYANTIFLVYLLFYPRNEKLFMVCFSFAEGPLAWALIVWRCSLVFSSVDKIVSVLIHLLPGLVFFTIRWWNPATLEAMRPEGSAGRAIWPYVEDKSYLWMWLFLVPLVVYTLWQVLYFLIVNVLRRQRFLRDPEVDFLQGTLQKSSESKQYMVASKWLAWGSKSLVNVHCSSRHIYCGNYSTDCSHILVI
ncbi:hypothetical protein SESBI_03999 [Sesbania bispinosa]|nr:hypothetical protein SESBI_03999 [Sesbania bispinosa]